MCATMDTGAPTPRKAMIRALEMEEDRVPGVHTYKHIPDSKSGLNSGQLRLRGPWAGTPPQARMCPLSSPLSQSRPIQKTH